MFYPLGMVSFLKPMLFCHMDASGPKILLYLIPTRMPWISCAANTFITAHGGCLTLTTLAPEGRHVHQLTRTEQEMAHLVAGIPEHDMGGHVVYRDDSGNILFLEVHRAVSC